MGDRNRRAKTSLNVKACKWNGLELQAEPLSFASPGRVCAWVLAQCSITGARGWLLRYPFWCAARAIHIFPAVLRKIGASEALLKGLEEEPAEVVHTADTVIQDYPLPSSSCIDGLAESAAATRVCGAYLDSWTLEMVPHAVELQYQEDRIAQELWWLVGARILSMVRCLMLLLRAGYSADTSAERSATVLMAASTSGFFLSSFLALRPSRRALSHLLGLVAEMAFGAFYTAMPVAFPAMLGRSPPHWRVLNDLFSPGLVGTLACEWLLRWLEVKDLWLLAIARSLSWLCSCCITGDSSARMRGLAQLLRYHAFCALCYLYERQQRYSFLRRLHAACRVRRAMHPGPAAQSVLSPVPLPGAAQEAEPDTALRLRYLQSCNLFLPRPMWVGSDSPGQTILHVHMADSNALALPESFRAALAEGLREQGLGISGSFVMHGSLLLAVLLEPEQPDCDPAQLDVHALAMKLRERREMRQLLQGGLSLQQGTKRTSFWGDQGSSQPAAPPELLHVHPGVLLAGQPTELHIRLRVPSPQQQLQLSVLLRLDSTTQVLRLPYDLRQMQGTEMLVCHAVTLHTGKGIATSSSQLLQVHDGNAFSAPWPLLVTSDPQLHREVADGLQLLTSPGSLPHISMTGQQAVWTLRTCLCLQQQVLSMQAGSRARAEAEQVVPRRVQRLAAAVRRNAPRLLGIATILGLPAVVRLLLHASAPAFQPKLAGGPGASAGGAAGEQVAVRLPGPQPACAGTDGLEMADAFVALVREAGEAAPVASTLLHLAVAAGVPAATLVLQEEAMRYGLLLNWSIPVAVLLTALDADTDDADGDADAAPMAALGALELAVLRLPASRPVALQAVVGNGALADAWPAAVASVLRLAPHIVPDDAAAAGRWKQAVLTMAAGVQSGLKGREEMGALLGFVDKPLEQEWLAEKGVPQMRSMDKARTLVCIGFGIGMCLLAAQPQRLPLHLVPCVVLVVFGNLLRPNGALLLVLRNSTIQGLFCYCPLMCAGMLPNIAAPVCSTVVPMTVGCGLLPLIGCPLPFRFQVWASGVILLVRVLQYSFGLPYSFPQCFDAYIHSSIFTAVTLLVLWVLEARARQHWLRTRTAAAKAV